MREKGGRKGAGKRTRKTLNLAPLCFRYSLVAFQESCTSAKVQICIHRSGSTQARAICTQAPG